MGPLSYNFTELSFKGKGFPKELIEEEMIIRHTFINSQQGQLVTYNNLDSKAAKKFTIRWIDTMKPHEAP
jgi:hypothetical protein